MRKRKLYFQKVRATATHTSIPVFPVDYSLSGLNNQLCLADSTAKNCHCKLQLLSVALFSRWGESYETG
jgi:hypothetical protein